VTTPQNNADPVKALLDGLSDLFGSASHLGEISRRGPLEDPAVQEIICDLSKGNPGAINVMCAWPELLPDILAADLTGSAIWQLYKNEAGRDREKFARLLKERRKHGAPGRE
jgi:hypothetical protein